MGTGGGNISGGVDRPISASSWRGRGAGECSGWTTHWAVLVHPRHPLSKGEMPPTPPCLGRAVITSTPVIAVADPALLEASVVPIPLSLPPRRAPACCCGTPADPRRRCSSAARPAWAGPTWPWPWARSSSTTTEELPRSPSKQGNPRGAGGIGGGDALCPV